MNKNHIQLILMLILIVLPVTVFSAEAPTVEVQSEPLEIRQLDSSISCYGMVNADPTSSTSVTVPYAGQITRLLVNQGEIVRSGAPLIEITRSETDATSYAQAVSSVEFSQLELNRVEKMVEQQLATRSQLAMAQKNFIDAKASLSLLKKLGTDTQTKILRAPYKGIVTVVNAAPGDRTQPGVALLQLAQLDRLKVTLGIEPENMQQVKSGMQVRIASIFDDKLSVIGKVGNVYGMINPRTRLVDVNVTIAPGRANHLIPGIRVKGVILLRRWKGIAAPRQAVLKDTQGSYIFVVRNSKAKRTAVTTGIEMNGIVAIEGKVSPGDRVVVLGNYELKDGMSVREQGQ